MHRRDAATHALVGGLRGGRPRRTRSGTGWALDAAMAHSNFVKCTDQALLADYQRRLYGQGYSAPSSIVIEEAEKRREPSKYYVYRIRVRGVGGLCRACRAPAQRRGRR